MFYSVEGCMMTTQQRLQKLDGSFWECAQEIPLIFVLYVNLDSALLRLGLPCKRTPKPQMAQKSNDFPKAVYTACLYLDVRNYFCLPPILWRINPPPKKSFFLESP